MTSPEKPTKSSPGSITAASGTAIGVGGMMGAGLYTLVGLASTTAGVWVPVAFLVGGAVTVFSVYSYAKLGARYPSRGGAAQFLIRCFGDGVIAGGLNVFQFLGWIIAMALYCTGFAGAQHPSTPGALTPSRSDRLFQILQRGFEITKQTLQVRHGPAAPDQAEFQTIGTVRGWPFDLGA
jgi:amino acid transporter